MLAFVPPGPGPAAWIMLRDPSPAELEQVRVRTGFVVPTGPDLREIESSSRLYMADGRLHMSLPLVSRGSGGVPQVSSLGLVLSDALLLTVQYGGHATSVSAGAEEAARQGSAFVLVWLLEDIVERFADELEAIGDELDDISRRLFHDDAVPGTKRRTGADLRTALRAIGRAGELVTKLTQTVLGLNRVLPFIHGNAALWLPAELAPRLTTLRSDIASLSEHDTHLARQIQFLMDSTVGLINIDQNNIIKVLAVVSTIGVPPTLIASVYGMNFEHMPELKLAYAYPVALLAILLSALLPLLWFRRRGWL